MQGALPKMMPKSVSFCACQCRRSDAIAIMRIYLDISEIVKVYIKNQVRRQRTGQCPIKVCRTSNSEDVANSSMLHVADAANSLLQLIDICNSPTLKSLDR